MKILLVALVCVLPLLGQEKEEAAPVGEAKQFMTQKTIRLGNESLTYAAHASETYLIDQKGKPEASIFSVAYLKDGVKDPGERPIAFVFNGGPGSSSIWLHIGLLGPRTVLVPSDGAGAGAPPYRMEPNTHSLLAVSDLVFIDPVGTGFSRALGKAKPEQFWGLDEDAQSIARFIKKFITQHRRWNSPKYIVGESYGTIRAAMLVRELQKNFQGIALNGVVLVAPALDMQTLMFSNGPDLPYVTYLPTYAATAWRHHQLPERPENLKAFLEEVSRFAATDYLTALFQGDALPEPEKERIIAKLHQYTGISKTYWRRANLRVNSTRFMKEALRDQGLTVGRLDSRYVEDDPDDVGEFPQNDPSSSIDGAYVAAFNHYLAQDLDVVMDREYNVLNFTANTRWKRPQSHQSIFSGYINVIPLLTRGAVENKDFRIFVANGYYDLTTTFFSAEYMFNHSNIPKDRITMKHYEAGHMMYLHEPSFAQLNKDLKEFIAAGRAGKP